MKVTFDSNVWQQVVCPDDYASDSLFQSYKKINKHLRERTILGFLGEPIFTIEAICKSGRQYYFQQHIPSFSYNVENRNQEIQTSISLGPDNTSHPGSNYYITRYMNKALKLGFRVLPCPRIAWIKNPDFRPNWYVEFSNDESFHEYNKKFSVLSEQITVKNCGTCELERIGKFYKQNGEHWMNGLKRAPESENKPIARALAEWADGDSIAAHFAFLNQYFCTLDNARNAGSKSVLSEVNRQWLESDYHLKFVTPSKLAKLI